jgi:endonuclease/exonuclease/phosphatase (EEP) superfamily protein YafD
LTDFETASPLTSSKGEDQAQPPNKKKLRHRQWGAAVLGLLAAIAGLIAGKLGQLYPDFDVFSQLGIQFCAMALGFSVAMLFSRFKALFGIAFTIMLLVAYGAWPHLVSSKLQTGPYPVSPDEKLLKIAHFNTYKNNADYTAISNEILRLDADVVIMLEMSIPKMQGVLPALKARYPHIADCDAGRQCDIAVLSKFPILSSAGDYDWAGPHYARASLGGAMQGVTIYGVHTARFPVTRLQFRQITEMTRLMEQTAGDIVMMGDFNATPFSQIHTKITQGSGLMRLTELPTWPAQLHLPQLAIDHVFASPAFRVVGNQQIGEAAGSDHYPIVLTLAYKKKQ